MTALLIQLVGLVGAALGIASYQCKSNRLYYSAQALSGLCFSVHFFLLGAYTGALLNFINIFRGFGFAAEKNKKPYVTLAVSCVLYLAATAFTFDGALSALACAAQLLGSVGMFFGHPTGMRVVQFLTVSPSWIVYNAFVGSLGGIVCEVFNMCSIVVYFLRVKVFEKRKNKA